MFRIPPTMDDVARARCDALIKMMEKACSEMLIAPDWTLNMQIVDELNREQDSVVLAEVIRILRKRLGSQDVRVLTVSLTLAEALVKNCGAPVHREVASERFMAAMAKIARTHSFKTRRESLSIADQALDIIQAWGEAFLPKRREFPLFVETYHILRAEGLPFKQQYQSDRPPVLDPGAGSLLDRGDSGSGRRGGRATGERGEKRGSRTPENAGGADPDEFAMLSVSNREIVSTGASCSEMLEQVLQAADSRAEVRKSDIAFELVEQLKATGPKIVRIIEANGDGDPALLGALFKVNDTVDNVLRLYKDVVDGVKSVPLLPPSRHSSGVDAVSKDMEKLAIGESAESSSKPGSVPTLSRPPSDRKGRRGKEKGHSQDSHGLGTPDLLSGFELEGASNASVNASNRVFIGGSGASATASTGQNYFPGFATPAATGRGGAGTIATEGIVGSQAGVMVAGGQVTGQQTTPPLPQQQQYPPQPALAGPKTSADKARSLIDNLGALYAGGNSSRQIGHEPMGSAGTLSTRTFPTYSEAGAGMAMAGGGKAAWAGSAGPGGSQGMTTVAGGGAVTVASGAGQASPFDTIGSSGAQAPQPQPQPFQHVGQEAHGQAGHSDQSFVGQDPFQGQAQDPFQRQPSQNQQQPTQPIQGYQQPQEFQQQPQGFQQPPQTFQPQQPQGFQQQPDVFQSPQGLHYQQPQAFQPQPQGFQQQQPQGFQQQQPQRYQQQPQGFQQQPQGFQQQHSFYGQQPYQQQF